MDPNLEHDLKRCLSMLSADWKMQSDYMDNLTDFIYRCDTLDECIEEIDKTGADKEYALHRWYNLMTSLACEHIFCEYGAVHENNAYNHDTDIYINNIPFDVKVTVYPAKLSDRPYDLKTRTGKNLMIQWYYDHQSQQSRKQILNRIYVVCDGKNAYECLAMKSNFTVLRQKIGAFMNYALHNGVNIITIADNGISHLLQSDIIYCL